MRLLVLFLVPAVAAASLAKSPDPCPVPPRNTVVRWNDAALAAIRAEKTPPPVAARNLAIVHVAIYDAVVAVDGGYDPFYFRADAVPGTDVRAAAAVAAHRALVDLYPGRVDDFDRALDDTLNHIPEGPGKTRGIALGQSVAERVLKWRSGDMKAARSDYTPRLDPGRWRPTPPDHRAPLLPGWGGVSCFAVADTAAFRPPGPPAPDSKEYAANLRIARALGSVASTVRTQEQTEVAFFWADGEGTVTPPGHWNQIAQSVAADRKLTLVESARLFAVLNVAMADAAVVCWECKYRYDVWRPVTALRATDPTWTPLLPTPPFPAYTSGHSSFSGAAAAALADFFGGDAVKFSSTSDGLPGVTRSFDSFSAAAKEAGMSRIYGGIHWEFDNADGLACGREVGEHVARNFFTPRTGRKDRGVPAAFPVLRRER
jgi:hypothetical protein